ncbi:hypothetical protein G6F36_013548 [Rhizopus arrhizus]|nr:hypothetical protein G6F36_013548 [Rhizopus arrhizus]
MVGFKDTLDMISLDALVIFVNAWVLIALGIRHPIAPWLHVLASVAMGQGPEDDGLGKSLGLALEEYDAKLKLGVSAAPNDVKKEDFELMLEKVGRA